MRLLSLSIFLLYVSLFSFGQIPSLPAYYSGPFAATAPPAGWSWTVNGTADVSLEGAGTAARLNVVGHFVQINLGLSNPTSVSYYLNSNDNTNARTVLVEHSNDGTNWTTVATHTQATVPIGGAGVGTFYTVALPCANFVRFYMSVRANGRFELDGITVGGSGFGYCQSNATSSADSRINNVTFNSINITNTAGCQVYTNNKCLSTTVMRGTLYPLNVTLGTCGGNYDKRVAIYIDYNNDGDFLDVGEMVGLSGTINGTAAYATNVTIPMAAVLGSTKMRVVCQETAGTPASCGTYTYGETEDYSINIIDALPPAPRAIHLTSDPQWVNIGDLDVSGNQITVEALVYYTGGVNILSKHTDPSNVNYLLRTGTFELTTTNGFCLMSNPYAGSMLPNTWYHVAGTYDGSFVRYYVNGCLIIEQPWTGNLITNNLAAAIGSQSTSPEQFYGQIDEVRIWNTARTQAEISANMMTLPSPTTQPNLLGYYKMDNSVVNVQGNAAFDGTWVGSSAYVVESAAIPTFSLNDVNPTNSTCLGANNGAINMQATGGSLQYSIDGSTWQASNNFSGLTPGAYTAYVRTQEGCIIPSSSVLISELNIPIVPEISLSDNLLCVGESINFETHGLAPGGLTASFNGSSATMANTNYDLLANNNFTYECWVKPNAVRQSSIQSNTGVDGVLTAQKYVISPNWGGALAAFAGISIGTNGVSVVEHGAGYAPIPLVWDGTISDWTHIAVVYNNRTPSLYINGALLQTGLQSTRATVYPCVGSYPIWSSEYFSGEIDNLRVYDYARNQTEIVADMYYEVPTNLTGLIANYNFDSGNGNALVGANVAMNNATFPPANHFTYTWTNGPSLPSPTTSETQSGTALLVPGNYNYIVSASNSVCVGTNSPSNSVTVDSHSTAPTISPVVGTICPNTDYTLSAVGGTAGSGSSIYWYTGANGTGTFLGTGATMVVAPTSNTTYYARREGTCNTTADASTTVNVKTYTYAANGASTNTYCTDNAGWQHFYIGDEIIFSVQGDLTTSPAGFPVASIYDHGTYYQETQGPGTAPGCASNQNPGEERFEMARSWNLDMGGGAPIGSYNIRFYYQPAEKTAIETAANAWMATYSACGYGYKYATPNGFYWFKNAGSNYTAPDYDGTHYGATISSVSGVNYAEWSGIPSFSGGSGAIILEPISTLPIELTSFAAICNETGDNADVQWTTASEHSTSHFVVDRSLDGQNWETLGSIPAAGNSTSSLHYALKDNETRGHSVIYYRLNQYDQDGALKTYGPISAECMNDQKGFELFPNPAGTDVTVLLHGDYENGIAQLVFTDMNGKEVKKILFEDDMSQLISIDLRNLEPGVYIVRLIDGETNSQFVRLVKQ